MKMTKRKLAEIYRELRSKELTINEAVKEVEDFLMVMEEALKTGKRIKFKRVGVMEIVDLKPRRIADPNTKEPMMIYPRKDVRFKESLTTIREKMRREEQKPE